ncbi:MAG: histidine--tRNA ligase [Chitinophagales bacterium]
MSKIKPALPKGFRDFLPKQVSKRKFMKNTISKVFEKYGFLEIDTPVMEKTTTLTGKYSDEVNKLLFQTLNTGDFLNGVDIENPEFHKANKLAKKISEKGMRYDLTVPLARYVIQHENDLTFPFKRYHIAPVWRADRPQKGRYREFYQCDIDIIGSKSLLNEVECVQVYNEVFEKLGLDVEILISNRKILNGIMQAIDATEISATIITLIDKIDKIGLEKVLEETQKAGLSIEQANMLKSFLETKKLEDLALSNELIKEGVEELKYIFDFDLANIKFDVSLARGADYYTGCIFEVVGSSKNPETSSFGALGGGGRYDNLTEMFGKKDLTGVGVSFGFERIYDVLESLNKFPENISAAPTLLFLHFGEEEKAFAFKLLQKVRKAGISSEIYPDKAKIQKQMKYANGKAVLYTCIIGSSEMESGKLSLKHMESGEQTKMSIEEIIEKLETSKEYTNNHNDISDLFDKFKESFNNIEETKFNLEQLEISKAIYKHVFKIKSSLWKFGEKFNRLKRSSMSDVFQDLIALYLKLELGNDYKIVLEEKIGKLQPDILVKHKNKNLFILEIKTTIGWDRNSLDGGIQNRIFDLSKTFNIPKDNIVYIFQSPTNVNKAFAEKYWDSKNRKAKKLPTEFPYNKIRPLLHAEDPFYWKENKNIEYHNYSNEYIENLSHYNIVIPLELTISEIKKAAKNI